MVATEKAYKGMGMEGSTARWYERNTRKDMPEFEKLAGRIAAMVGAGGRILEVAPGPGFLSVELARRGLGVRGVDISKTCVEIAQRNAAEAGVDARFEQGNAAALPAGDASVDFVVCRAAFKNFTEPVKALREMRRVLRPGGMALLIDLRRDVSMTDVRRYVDGTGLSWWNRWMTKFIFRNVLIKRAYRIEDIRRMTLEAGWVEPRIEADGIGFEAWMTK